MDTFDIWEMRWSVFVFVFNLRSGLPVAGCRLRMAGSRVPLSPNPYLLRAGREEILRDWVERSRDNTAVKTGDALSDPLLLDHLPQLFDAILDRLAVNRSREDAEQFAAVHGFTRRISGYDVLETVIELMMFRHAIWAHLTAIAAPVDGSFAAMEVIDGMVDRAVISSLRAFLDPSARMLVRKGLGLDEEPAPLSTS